MARWRRLIGGAAVLGSGTVASQAIGALAMLLIARLYTPEAFGMFALFFTGAQLLGATLAWRFEQAIILARNEAEARALVTLCIVVAILGAGGLLPFLVLAAPLLDRAFDASLGRFWVLVTAAGLFLSITTTLGIAAVRDGRLLHVSQSRIGKALVTATGQLLLVLAGFGGIAGLIAGELLGTLASAGLLIRASARGRPREPSISASPRRLLALARRYADFALYSLPQVLLNNAAAWILLWIITASFTAESTGQYFMMQRLVSIPTGIVAVALSHVYFREGAEALRDKGEFATVFGRTLAIAGAIAAAYLIGLLIAGPFLIRLVLGTEWVQASHLARIYAPYVAAQLVLATMTPTAMIAGRMRASLWIGLGQILLQPLALLAGIALFGTLEAATGFSVACMVPYMAGYLGWYARVARQVRGGQGRH